MNKDFLIYQKPQKHRLIVVSTSFLLIFLIILTFKIKIYNTYITYGLITCNEECYLNITMSYENIEILSNDYNILIDDKEYEIEEVIYNEPYLSENIPYEDISIYLKDLKETSKIVKVKIKYHKQRIITKIINQIIERE